MNERRSASPRLDRAISTGLGSVEVGDGDTEAGAYVSGRVRLFAGVNFFGFATAAIWYHWIPLLRGTWKSEELHYLLTSHLVALVSFLTWRRARSGHAVPVRSATCLYFLSAFILSVPLGRLDPPDPDAPVYGIPWVCVLILMFPLIVPLPTRRHAIFGVIVALFWPAGQLARALVGAEVLPLALNLNSTFAGLLCAAVGILTSRLMQRLGAEIAQARAKVRELGSYRLEEKLGQGGMGEVWRARHKLLARPAAVKLIRTSGEPNAARREELLARFEREARATARLRSHHTVEVYDFGRTLDGEFYYAMELLDGLDLHRLIDEEGPQPIDRVIAILEQICWSLMEAHSLGLVHRDIKPANVFLCREGHELDVVKLLDFGLVIEPDAIRRGERSITGTPDFMSPESAEGVEALSARSDLYSLGCVGYWLLTGRTLFRESSAVDTLIAHAERSPEPLSRFRPTDLPASLGQLIERCLSKRTAERPESAAAVRELLAAIDPVGDWDDGRRAAWWAARPPLAPDSATPSTIASSEAPTILPTETILAPPEGAGGWAETREV